MLGPKCFHNGQVSTAYSNDAEKSETNIGTLEPASTGVPFPGKKVLPYKDNVVNDSLGWMGQTTWRRLRHLLRGWTKELLNLHQKGNAKRN